MIIAAGSVLCFYQKKQSSLSLLHFAFLILGTAALFLLAPFVPLILLTAFVLSFALMSLKLPKFFGACFYLFFLVILWQISQQYEIPNDRYFEYRKNHQELFAIYTSPFNKNTEEPPFDYLKSHSGYYLGNDVYWISDGGRQIEDLAHESILLASHWIGEKFPGEILRVATLVTPRLCTLNHSASNIFFQNEFPLFSCKGNHPREEHHRLDFTLLSNPENLSELRSGSHWVCKRFRFHDASIGEVTPISEFSIDHPKSTYSIQLNRSYCIVRGPPSFWSRGLPTSLTQHLKNKPKT